MTRQPVLKFLMPPMIAAGLAACSGNNQESPAIQRSLALTHFETCTDLETYIEDAAVQQMRNQMDPDLQVGFGGDIAIANEATAGGQAAGGGGAARSSPNDFTRTNTQVAGVDEADFVKTNGTHIFAIAGRKLNIAKSWPANELALQSSLQIEGYPREMFLEEDENRISVLSTVPGTHWMEGAPILPWHCGFWGCGDARPVTKLTVVDVADTEAPMVVSEQYLPGHYNNARRVGSTVRLVLSDDVNWPADIQWWPEYEEGLWENEGRLKSKLRALMDENEAKIRAQSLDAWLPVARHRAAGTLVETQYTCDSYSRSNAPIALGLTTVATVNLDNPGQIQSTVVVARTGEIYANQDALYLTNRHWWWFSRPGQTDYTYVFKLDTSSPGRTDLVAAGGVEGHLLDQFSMDEHDGFFRVATTIAKRVEEDDNPWGRVETTNRVSVFDGSMNLVGQTEDLAKDERIFSARFLGERGYVVTFRQVDPLFTIDLSNPRNPRVVGELKVPGFSTYLHPLAQDHLLAIGIHQPEPDPSGRFDWEQRAMKLTIFDVSDMENPIEKHTQIVGSAYSWSEALHEHKAFNYFASRKTLAIPFSDWQPWRSGDDYWNGFVSDVRVFDIDVDQGISLKGNLSMRDIYVSDGYGDWTYYYSPWIRRSVMADEYVYAISDAGIRVAHENDLSTPITTIRFERAPAQ